MIQRLRVIGGPCGKPVRYPNSKVKRGWSQTAALWRFDDQPLPQTIWCRHQRYTLNLGPPPFYAYDPDLAARAEIMRSVGDQRYWRRQFS